MRRRNPYSYGLSVSGEQFVGRQAELQALANRILDPPTPLPCSVVGETRIGKSSLLAAFEQIVREEQRPELICLRYDMSSDFREISPDSDDIHKAGTSAFYRNFVRRISDDLSDYPQFDHRSARLASDPQLQHEMTGHIQKFFRSIRRAGFWLMLILDEFDATTEYFRFDPTGWKLLRNLGSEQDKYGLCYLFASRRPLMVLEADAGISSNLANIFETVRLGLMPPDEARELVEEPIKRSGLAWSPELSELILRTGGNHPYCLQMLCSHLFYPYEQNSLPPDLDEMKLIRLVSPSYRSFFEGQRQRLERGRLFEPLLRIAHGVPVQVETFQIQELIDLGHLLPITEGRNRFQPFSLALDLYLRAYGAQEQMWPLIEETEAVLQKLTERQYRAHFGESWLDEIRSRNPGGGVGDLARPPMVARWEAAQELRSLNPFMVLEEKPDLIQFASPLDLKLLIDQQPQLFSQIFPWQTYEVREEALARLHTIRDTQKARYRRLSQDEVQQTEQACEKMLGLIRPYLAKNSSRPLALRHAEALPQVGEIISGQYEILRVVKRTKHSYVVKARDGKLERDVAIKFLLNIDTTSDNWEIERANLEREGKLLAMLNHPNIGTVHNTTSEPPGVVLAWIESGQLSLTDYTSSDAQDMPLEMVVTLGIQLCSALDYIHQRKIIHRDIKPNNILLNEQQVPILIDFDIARSPDHETISQDKYGVFRYVGNELYSSPEQFLTPGKVTTATDIFSLGGVLYQLLTHRIPFINYNNPDNYQDGLLPPLEQEDIPAPLFTILRLMLRQPPEERPSALELQRHFTQYLASLRDTNHPQ